MMKLPLHINQSTESSDISKRKVLTKAKKTEKTGTKKSLELSCVSTMWDLFIICFTVPTPKAESLNL